MIVMKEPACNAGDTNSTPGWGRSPGGGKWQPTLVFLSGKSHGWRSLVGYRATVHRVASDTTK